MTRTRKTATDRTRTEYKPITREEWQRRIQYGRFPEAMRQAYGGNLEPLHKYLDTYLPSDHAAVIAEFHKRRLRPDYKEPLSLEQEAGKLIGTRAKSLLNEWRRRYGKLPKGALQLAINVATELLVDDGELQVTDPDRIDFKIDFKKIRNTVGRGDKKKSSTIKNNKS